MDSTAGPIEPVTALNRDVDKMSRGQEEDFIWTKPGMGLGVSIGQWI